MKITTAQLKRIIREEIQRSINETMDVNIKYNKLGKVIESIDSANEAIYSDNIRVASGNIASALSILKNIFSQEIEETQEDVDIQSAILDLQDIFQDLNKPQDLKKSILARISSVRDFVVQIQENLVKDKFKKI